MQFSKIFIMAIVLLAISGFAEAKTIKIPINTKIKLQFDEKVASTSVTEDLYITTTEDVVIDSVTVIPKGTAIMAEVPTKKNPMGVAVHFKSVQGIQKTEIPLSGRVLVAPIMPRSVGFGVGPFALGVPVTSGQPASLAKGSKNTATVSKDISIEISEPAESVESIENTELLKK